MIDRRTINITDYDFFIIIDPYLGKNWFKNSVNKNAFVWEYFISKIIFEVKPDTPSLSRVITQITNELIIIDEWK